MEPAKLAAWAGVAAVIVAVGGGMWAWVGQYADHRGEHRDIDRRLGGLEKSQDVMIEQILRHRELHIQVRRPPPRADRDHMTLPPPPGGATVPQAPLRPQ